MTTKRTILLALATTLAALILPASALAEYLVPEGNSAVNQYTEGLPSAGGEKGTRAGEEKTPVKPGSAIGANNARKLEDKGSEGAAAAEVAAETAPLDVPAPESTGDGEGKAQHAKNGKQGSGSKHGADNGSGDGEEEAAAAPAAAGDSGSGGSSGVGELVSAATGVDSGHLGILLPLVILAAIAWAFVFAWRQRKRPAAQ